MRNANPFLFGGLRNLSAVFLTGGHTRLWGAWGSEKVVPGYDKLYYLRKGRFSFDINGQLWEGRPGQLFLLPCNSVQTYHAYNDETALKYWVHCNFWCGEQDLLELIALPMYIEVEDPDYVEALFGKILAHDHPNDLISTLIQKACLTELLAYYIEKGRAEMPLLLKDDRIAAVIRYIEANLTTEITVDTLAGIAHLSAHYFIKYFKKSTSFSPMEYVTNARVSRAKQLLSEDAHSIKDIAEMVGFHTACYFSRIFKQRTGYSPHQYRITACRRVQSDGNPE